jgi:hypothetical protein
MKGSKVFFLVKKNQKLSFALQRRGRGDAGVTKMDEVFLLPCFQTRKASLALRTLACAGRACH